MMDISLTYVKMCEKADLHPSRSDLEGKDFYSYIEPWECRCGKYKGKRYKGVICDKCGTTLGKPIWLPRQDQLQEMISNRDPHQLIYALSNDLEAHDADYILGKDKRTMEQLWLAFVMSQRYQKRWDGETWTIIKS